MTKIFFAFLLVIVAGSVHAQTGKVYFLRSDGFTAPAAAFNLFVDQKPLGHINNKRYVVHNINPGSHHFSTQFSGKKAKDKSEKLEENIEAGKTYYIKLSFQHGIFKNKLHFKEVDEKEANKMLPGLRETKS